MNLESTNISNEKNYIKPQDIVTQDLIEELKTYGIINPEDPWLAYESFKLTEDKVKQIEALFELDLMGELASETDEAICYIATHGWRILSAKNYFASIPALIDLLRSASIEDDWIHDEIPRILVKFGTLSIDPIIKSFKEHTLFGSELYELAALTETLTEIAQNHPESKIKITDFLGNLLEDFEILHPDFNSYVIIALTDLQSTEHTPLIQKVFEKKYWGEDVIDWEWIREKYSGLVNLPEKINFEKFKQNDFHYSCDEKFQKLLKTLNSLYNIKDVKLQLLGSLLAVDMVQPNHIADLILKPDEDDKAEAVDFQSEGQAHYFYQEFFGLWNNLAEYQNKLYPFPNIEIDEEWTNSSTNLFILIQLSTHIFSFTSGLDLGNTTIDRLGTQDTTQFISYLEEKLDEISKLLESSKYKDPNCSAKLLFNEVAEFWNKHYLTFATDCQTKRKEVMEKARFIEQHKNIGRNDPCPCGSGKKFKKCCLTEH
jgi:uncharacterized protein YchJ